MGKGDNESAEKTMGSCFTAQLVISAALTAVLLIFSKDLLLAFGASENTIDYAHSYMTVYAVGTVFVQLTLGMNAYITAQGFAKTSMLTTLIGAILNIALDPLFIFGFGLGVRGAALATVISQAVSCLWVLLFLSGKRSILRLRPKNLIPDVSLLLPCLALGLAPFVMQSSESVIAVAFNSSLLEYGGDIAVGAMTILTSVMQLALLPLQGLSQGAQPITSYNFGAGRLDRVKQSFRLLLTVSLSYSMAVWALAMLFPHVFASILPQIPS
jgi:putative MATE family efflux protein